MASLMLVATLQLQMHNVPACLRQLDFQINLFLLHFRLNSNSFRVPKQCISSHVSAIFGAHILKFYFHLWQNGIALYA